ncbi:MAG: hypothetical protein KAQ94_06105 [Arcobacteraceae bacterium]|nr:hypothetical protein [Arcobacteraceae bacterium]
MKLKPSIKFSILGKSSDFEEIVGVSVMANYIRTAFDGSIVEFCDYKTKFENWDCQEISFDEALSSFIDKEKMKKVNGFTMYFKIKENEKYINAKDNVICTARHKRFKRISFKLASYLQLLLWKLNINTHNLVNKECTPDFSCCIDEKSINTHPCSACNKVVDIEEICRVTLLCDECWVKYEEPKLKKEKQC